MKFSPSILVFSTLHLPTGGIESHLQEFCLQMTNSGVSIDLVILNSEMLPETEAFYRKVCRKVFIASFGNSHKRLLWMTWLGIKLRTRGYDALYTNGQGSSILFFASLVNCSGNWVHHHHTAGDKSDQATWNQWYRKALKKADKVIACSVRNANSINGALNRKIYVITCFSRKVEPYAPLFKESKKLRFGYFGRLIPEKGIDLLCEFSKDEDFNEIEFHLWGEGKLYPGSYFSKFPNVHYHGSFWGPVALSKVIGSLDASLLLSTHPEGLPISLLEAMSAGLPWLATDRGGIPDIQCDPVSTKVIPHESTYLQFKNAVLSFAADLRTKPKSKKNQVELYTSKFSSAILVSEWKQVLGLHDSLLKLSN
jgi:glycosyltransferase involved in cell wall biosynthesis